MSKALKWMGAALILFLVQIITSMFLDLILDAAVLGMLGYLAKKKSDDDYLA